MRDVSRVSLWGTSLIVVLAVIGSVLSSDAHAQPYMVKYAYDAQGRLTTVAYTDSTGIIYAYDAAGNITSINVGEISVGTETADEWPNAFALHPSYPNPFNPTTVIPFDVKAPAHVRLTVYDLLGRRTALLVDERRKPGRYEATFDAAHLPSGVYVYAIEMGDYQKTRSMVFVK